MHNIKTLSEIEKEMLIVLTDGKSYWTKCYVYANYELEYEENIYQWDILIAETVSSKIADLRIHGLILLKDDLTLSLEHIDMYKMFTYCHWIIVPDQYEHLENIPEKFGIISINPNSPKERITEIREPKYEKGIHKCHLITKLLTDHLFEYSMQDIHQKQLEPQSLDEAFRVAIDSLVDDLKARGFSVETELEWKNCYVQVNPEYIHRIIENIVSNIEKYAEKKAVIRMDMIYIDKFCGFSVMNTIFPDTSYVDSNGVGIDSIRTMMEEMKGNCNVEQTDTTFEMTLLFPIQ